MSDKEIASQLNRSESAVSRRRQTLKLFRESKHIKKHTKRSDFIVITNPKYKKCKICENIFLNTSEYFYRDRKGLRSHCKKCNQEKQSEIRRSKGAFTKELKQEKLKQNLSYCGKCKTWKSIDSFHLDCGDLNKIHRWCKDCEVVYYREYYLKNIFGDNFIEEYKSKNSHLFDRNGEKCDSTSEKIISDWFIENNIFYIKSPLYKNHIENEQSNKKFDWLIRANGNEYLVEYFGLWDTQAKNNYLYKYTKKAKKKIKLLYKNNLHHKAILIFPNDLKNKSLEEIFSKIF